MDNERKHAGGGDNHMSDEFTIRVSGAAPPPIPTATLTTGKNIKKKSGKKRDACAMPQQRRIELKLHPSSTLNDLRRNVLASYDVPDAARNAYDVSFLGGFPPRPMCEGKDGDTSIYELGIRPNESLIVKFVLVDEHDTHAEGSASTTTSSEDNSSQQPDTSSSSSSSSNNNLGGREKRASAVAATASFRDVIAAQDAAMKASSSTKNKNGSNRNAGSSKRIATTLGGGSSVTAGVKRPKPVRMEGTGFRLSDGKSFAGSSSPMAKKKGSREGEGAFKNEDDVANRLLSSLGGGGGGNVGKYLRSAMRSAVSKSYEASRASVRVASVDAGEYSLQIVKSGTVMVGGGVVLGTANDHRKTEEGDDTVDHDVDLGRTLFVASYSKGMDGRGTYEETVEIIGLAILRSVLESVYNTDPSSNDDDEYGPPKTEDGRLRPVLIAQLSPRVFWSLVYHCGGGDDGSSGGEDRQLTAPRPCVEDMLRTVLPQLDWSHLDRGGRLRALSEKARENLRQTTANEESQDDDDHAEARVKAIEDLAESVLNAADEEEEVHLTESERRARAALARFGNDKDANTTSSLKTDVSSCEDNWTLVTPIEDDIDELMECIMECKPEEGDTYNEEAAGRWAGLLIKSDVRNWREMANSDPQYVYSLIGNCSVAKILQETVEQWVDAARIRSLEEIMLDILDSDQDALEALQDKARSCSPRDLMLWKSAPAMLIDAVSPPDERRWEEADAVRWISRAKIALSTCPWLNDYNFNS